MSLGEWSSRDATVFLGKSCAWMLGKTPPSAIVTLPRSTLSSSSFLTASWMWRGTMRNFLLSRQAFPANPSTSAHMYSMTAARYTAAPLPIRLAYLPFFNRRAMRPTGKVRPALLDLLVDFLSFATTALPRPDIFKFWDLGGDHFRSSCQAIKNIYWLPWRLDFKTYITVFLTLRLNSHTRKCQQRIGYLILTDVLECRVVLNSSLMIIFTLFYIISKQ